MPCRGVRGATTIEKNEREEILTATRQLLALMIRQNEIEPTDVASAVFTTTPDIDAEFPAMAARQLGWLDVPLLCGHEMTVPGSLPLCIRVLVHWNTTKPQAEIEHVYVREAKRLRPDLSKLPPVDMDLNHARLPIPPLGLSVKIPAWQMALALARPLSRRLSNAEALGLFLLPKRRCRRPWIGRLRSLVGAASWRRGRCACRDDSRR